MLRDLVFIIWLGFCIAIDIKEVLDTFLVIIHKFSKVIEFSNKFLFIVICISAFLIFIISSCSLVLFEFFLQKVHLLSKLFEKFLEVIVADLEGIGFAQIIGLNPVHIVQTKESSADW